VVEIRAALAKDVAGQSRPLLAWVQPSAGDDQILGKADQVKNRCEICGKGVTFGHNVSHSNRKTARRWIPNIQKTTIYINGNASRVHACTRCIRTARKLATA
jgi:large subunit ribosomal protein L28